MKKPKNSLVVSIKGIANKLISAIQVEDPFTGNIVSVITEQVTECDELSNDGSVGALLGMNIISTGDFAVSNYRGRTKFTFRSPSIAHVDYTKKQSTNLA